ncbi:MAG TPA: YetF domain-containing protein [Gemmatimonadales bacterium]|nr:YetF domain-containing protein [Gemmatimonadales bacterium]
MILAGINWHNVFVPSESLAELFLRGSLLYLFILALMRVFRREAGTLSIPDLLVVVLVADAAQNGMSADYHSVTEAFVLVGTIFLWDYALDWLAFRSRTVHRLLHPAPLPLVKDGKILRRNLKAELLTVDDLLGQLREQGVNDVREVKRSFIESDGHLSIIKYEPAEQPQHQPQRKRGLA